MTAGEIPTTLLQTLNDGACMTLDTLEAETALTRRQISDGVARLILRKLAERTEKGCYQLTEAGKKAAGKGMAIKSGPWRGLTGGVRQPMRKTFLQRAWSAMRLTRTFTLGEIVIAAGDKEKNPEDHASRYIRRLKAAGYVHEMPNRAPGTKPTSNGFKRYSLIKDTGLEAPVYRPSLGVLHDANTGENIKCGK